MSSRGHVAKPADVYSLGVLLHEMYAGPPPWRRRASSLLASSERAAAATAGGGQAGGQAGGGGGGGGNHRGFSVVLPEHCPAPFHDLISACTSFDPKVGVMMTSRRGVTLEEVTRVRCDREEV